MKIKRKLVVGDIHGGYIALRQILERCEYNSSEDQLIFLGDYVDGWSESSEVVQQLIEIEENTSIKPIFLRGNHDKWCEDWLTKGQVHPYWLPQGGQQTIDSYVSSGYIIEDSHKEFFKNLVNYYVDEENRGFVHGGYYSAKGLGHEKYEADYYWDRGFWNLAVVHHGKGIPSTNGITIYDKHKEVYVGHTTTMSYTCKPHLPESKLQDSGSGIHVPMNRCNVWNMDTGSGYKGKLTIMDIDSKEIWQSDFLSDLYPNERGR